MLRFSIRSALILCVFVAVAMMMAVATFTMPSSATVEAHQRGLLAACHTEQIALDEGYGVSRIAERRVCENL